MKFEFLKAVKPESISEADWLDWRWQMRNALKTHADFAAHFELSEGEQRGFAGVDKVFQVRTTPYYASLASREQEFDPIRRIFMPHKKELEVGLQQMPDPLGENRHRPAKRIIHRYPDRVLFLVTDICSVYCRYCTRKHFTGQDQAFAVHNEYDEALNYIRQNLGIREVILSGGDPLTLGDAHLEKVLSDLRAIEHVEIIRIGTRVPVVCPMRVTPELVQILRSYQPVMIMTHFNHPREITFEAKQALELFVDHGLPVFNQMVLLNGVNNHPAIVQALSRRLLYLRVKPYYMFQCDPSEGTDHLRTSIQNSKWIQKELWGRLSGLAMPNLSIDIPGGGGKLGVVPDFSEGHMSSTTDGVDHSTNLTLRGWDGFEAEYKNPPDSEMLIPLDAENYFAEWRSIADQIYGAAGV